jgi:hypothetical protein
MTRNIAKARFYARESKIHSASGILTLTSPDVTIAVSSSLQAPCSTERVWNLGFEHGETATISTVG